jgi:hypothetical protein
MRCEEGLSNFGKAPKSEHSKTPSSQFAAFVCLAPFSRLTLCPALAELGFPPAPFQPFFVELGGKPPRTVLNQLSTDGV